MSICKIGYFYKVLNDKTGALEIKAGGLSTKTIRNLHNMLHKTFGQAYKNGLVLTNVIDLVTPPRVIKSEMRVLALQEQRNLLEQAKAHRLGIVVILGSAPECALAKCLR